jgi:hypothetical protein
MEISIRDKFISLWKKYFGDVELPITFYYSDDDGTFEHLKPRKGRSCLICELAKVRKGKSLAFSEEEIKCGGGKRYTGFTDKLRPNFEYFLSCGIPGTMEGERYIQSPGMVAEVLKNMKVLPAVGKFLIFRRWDLLEETDKPEVVIFFARGEVLSGLFTLAIFDQVEPNGVISPFGAGCGSIIHYPRIEQQSERPRAVLGMFDPSARPCVPVDWLSFAVPMKKFVKMIDYMEDSFLITPTWKKVLKKYKDSQV